VKNNILITGGSGLLGVNLAIKLRNIFNVFLLINKRYIVIENTKNIRLNLFKTNELNNFVKQNNIKFIINTIALTDVDLCEKNKSNAKKINAELTKKIAKICKKQKIKIIHISTDQLFNGKKKLMNERSKPNPINHYGKTKLLAEKYIKKFSKNFLIIRTNFFGVGTSYRRSYSEYIMYNVNKGKVIKLTDDIFFTPISIYLLIDILMKLIIQNKKGIFNIVGNERISKYQFGKIIAKEFNLNQKFIYKIKSVYNKKNALRPKDMSLSNEKIKNNLNIKIPSIKNQIKYIKTIYQNKKNFDIFKL
tara:strand:+ start:68610 stop:69524 length:915 start_codon:yes stop_codon:yes gene_type:complete